MKLSKYISVILLVTILATCFSSCRGKKDCRGRKKTAKTAMGGWL